MKTNKLSFFLFLSLFLILKCESDVKNHIRFESNVITPNMLNTVFNNTKFYPDNTEIAIAVIVGDETEFLGLRKTKNTIIAVDNRHKIFEIGSVSKVFLCSLLAICLEKKMIALEDPMEKHSSMILSEYGRDGVPVKIVHLANHTSGIKPIPDGLIKDYEYQPSEENEIEKVGDYLAVHCGYSFTPGTGYEYSNLGMALLGMIICRKLDGDYESLVRTYIASPLKMKRTMVTLNEELKKDMIIGRDQYGKAAPLLMSELYVCSGGLKSTAEDLTLFIRENMKDDTWTRLCHEKTYEIDDKYDVALGWHYSKTHKERVYYHHGGTVGYSCGIAFEKDNDVGVVVLSNISALLRDRPDITKLMYDLFGQIERNIAR